MKWPNNRMHSDSKKRRSFVALLFAAGDASREAQHQVGGFVLAQEVFYTRFSKNSKSPLGVFIDSSRVSPELFT
jgi:hypothetical protein